MGVSSAGLAAILATAVSSFQAEQGRLGIFSHRQWWEPRELDKPLSLLLWYGQAACVVCLCVFFVFLFSPARPEEMWLTTGTRMVEKQKKKKLSFGVR